jgi:hypothetical protein
MLLVFALLFSALASSSSTSSSGHSVRPALRTGATSAASSATSPCSLLVVAEEGRRTRSASMRVSHARPCVRPHRSFSPFFVCGSFLVLVRFALFGLIFVWVLSLVLRRVVVGVGLSLCSLFLSFCFDLCADDDGM